MVEEVKDAALSVPKAAWEAMDVAYVGSGLNVKMAEYKAGNMNVMEMAPAAAAFVVVGIVIATGLVVLGNYKTSLTTGSAEQNATSKAIEGIGKLADQLPTIGLALAAAIVIAIIFGAFAYIMYRKQE
jgi:hypothetical protein